MIHENSCGRCLQAAAALLYTGPGADRLTRRRRIPRRQRRPPRREEKRFAAAGVAAAAEVIAVRGIRGGTEVAELAVRIRGTGFDPFVTDCDLPVRQPPWAVGDTFDVVVDPADKFFAVVY
ncbi:hypothetical protein [Nocardia jinanensis]|uniref:Uncharacterized protein n=1 Tax=Nocardia jinanensis TaxID=382504 RepID=A0A917RXE1_9NOCA|nr:hypothetical protein [Nocardia jinanensis]GGL39735.1 hypothetical protein GCM10011588_63170 [Nocardia jinanensis]